MNLDHTEIVVVLDRSGSMETIRKDMEGGLNTFFEEQKKEPGKCTVTFTQFDTEYEILYSGKDLKEVPPVKITPRGWTALLDAVGRTINEVGERLNKTPEQDRPGRVLFVVVTDGHENRSTEFTKEKIKEMIKHQSEKYQWQFVYLGANQDSFTEASLLGISIAGDFKADASGVKHMVHSLSVGTRSYRSGGGYTG